MALYQYKNVYLLADYIPYRQEGIAIYAAYTNNGLISVFWLLRLFYLFDVYFFFLNFQVGVCALFVAKKGRIWVIISDKMAQM